MCTQSCRVTLNISVHKYLFRHLRLAVLRASARVVTVWVRVCVRVLAKSWCLFSYLAELIFFRFVYFEHKNARKWDAVGTLYNTYKQHDVLHEIRVDMRAHTDWECFCSLPIDMFSQTRALFICAPTLYWREANGPIRVCREVVFHSHSSLNFSFIALLLYCFWFIYLAWIIIFFNASDLI